MLYGLCHLWISFPISPIRELDLIEDRLTKLYQLDNKGRGFDYTSFPIVFICLFIGLLHRGIAWTSFFINIDQKLARKQLTQIPLAILLKALRWTLEGRVGEEGSIAGLSRQFPRTQDYK